MFKQKSINKTQNPAGQVAKSQPVPISDEEFEKVVLELNKQEDLFEDKIEKYSTMIELLRGQAYSFIQQKKKKAAHQKISEINQVDKLLKNVENMKLVFFKTRIQLRNGKGNIDAINTLKKAASLLQAVDPQEMEEIVDAFEEIQEKADEIADYFKDLANGDGELEKIEEEMRKLQEEVDKDNLIAIKQQVNAIPQATINHPVMGYQQDYYRPMPA